MKTKSTIMMLLLSVFAFSTVSLAEPADEFRFVPIPPGPGGRISDTIEFPGKCIGGDICGQRERLFINLGGLPVRKFTLRAHDNVGDSHDATLDIYVNGRRIERKFDIKKETREFSFHINDIVDSIEFVPSSDDEVMIKWVRVQLDQQF